MLKNYLKLAFKVLLRRKAFTFISLFGISVTLLVLVVASALLDNSFSAGPPETKADRSLTVFSMKMRGTQISRTSEAGYGFLDRYVRTLPNVEKVSIFSTPAMVTSYVNGHRIESYLKHTDGQFWEILEFRFLEGGPITVQDEQQGNHVAVINEATRQRFFQGASAVGKTVDADGQSFRVVGVVANVPIVRLVPFADIWVPISTNKSSSYQHEIMGGFMALILAHGAKDFEAIKAEFATRLPQVPLPEGFDELLGGPETFLDSISREIFGGDRYENHVDRLKAVQFGLMVLFLLLPTINLVNLNLSRILERSSEIGVRKAFGASSWVLCGQFIVENLVLTLCGGLIAFVLAHFVLGAINASGLVPYAQFALNLRVLLVGLAIAAFFSLMSGVYPAWRMSRLHPVGALSGRS